MSSPPTKYVKSFDYAANPSLNTDFDRLKVTTDQTIDRLALIQRDDGNLVDGIFTTNSIADGAVTEPKLANLSVSTRTLQDLCVTTAKIALLAVGSAQLSDLAVTQAKLGLLSIGTPQLIDLSVSTPKILDAAVTSAKLAPSLALAGVPTAPTALTGTNTTQLATTAFVAASMSAAGMITEAPNDGKLYGRFALGWQRGVAVAGDTMTGLLLLSADPAAALGAATKQYVDAAALTLSNAKVAKAGDTMTGNLGIGIAPPAWDAGTRALSVGSAVNISGGANPTSASGSFTVNTYYDGANHKYITANAAQLFNAANGNFDFYNAPVGAAGAVATYALRMRLDGNGNLGLGGTAPAWDAATRGILVGSAASITGATGAAASASFTCNSYYDGANHKYLTVNPASVYISANGDHSWYTAPAGAIGANVVYTERLRLSVLGRLTMGLAGNWATALVEFAGTGNLMSVYNTTANPGACYLARVNDVTPQFMNFFYNTTKTGAIYTPDGVNTSYITGPSDHRLKNITGDFLNSGAIIDALRPKIGTWKSNGKLFIGLIADDVQAIPELAQDVVGARDAVDDDGNPVYQMMTYTSQIMQTCIIAELKSLRARVAAGGL